MMMIMQVVVSQEVSSRKWSRHANCRHIKGTNIRMRRQLRTASSEQKGRSNCDD